MNYKQIQRQDSNTVTAIRIVPNIKNANAAHKGYDEKKIIWTEPNEKDTSRLEAPRKMGLYDPRIHNLLHGSGRLNAAANLAPH